MTSIYYVSSNTVIKDGVMRWKSNNRIPFDDILTFAKESGFNFDLEKSQFTREQENDAFIAEYRKNHSEPTLDERINARAAFGPGVELKCIVTGKKWTT